MWSPAAIPSHRLCPFPCQTNAPRGMISVFQYMKGTRRQLELALPLAFHAGSWKYCRAAVLLAGVTFPGSWSPVPAANTLISAN